MENSQIREEDLMLEMKGINHQKAKINFYLSDLDFMAWVNKNYSKSIFGWCNDYFGLRALRIKYLRLKLLKGGIENES